MGYCFTFAIVSGIVISVCFLVLKATRQPFLIQSFFRRENQNEKSNYHLCP